MDSIIYENQLQIRFSDLDGYGHMNSNIYADLLATSRLLFLEEGVRGSAELLGRAQNRILRERFRDKIQISCGWFGKGRGKISSHFDHRSRF